MKTTRAAVNAALKAQGIDAELVQGKGYCYFAGPATIEFFATAVSTMRVSDLSVEQWLESFAALAANADKLN